MKQKNNLEIALQERIKELNCFYGMARLAEQNHNSMDDFLRNLADFLPLSWRYSEIACALINFEGKTFESKNYRWTQWRQSAEILVNGRPLGDLSIIYLEERPLADEGPFLKEERTLLNTVAEHIGEIAVRLIAEQALQENNKQLLIERKALQEANAALRVVLANIEDEKKQICKNIRVNIDKVIMPILHAMAPAVSESKHKYLDMLKTNLEEITSPFTSQIINNFQFLTPAEINICNMIRNGLRTKEIAHLRGVSVTTVSRHREHIRKKLKITNEQINLTTYLQSIVSG